MAALHFSTQCHHQSWPNHTSRYADDFWCVALLCWCISLILSNMLFADLHFVDPDSFNCVLWLTLWTLCLMLDFAIRDYLVSSCQNCWMIWLLLFTSIWWSYPVAQHGLSDSSVFVDSEPNWEKQAHTALLLLVFWIILSAASLNPCTIFGMSSDFASIVCCCGVACAQWWSRFCCLSVFFFYVDFCAHLLGCFNTKRNSLKAGAKEVTHTIFRKAGVDNDRWPVFGSCIHPSHNSSWCDGNLLIFLMQVKSDKKCSKPADTTLWIPSSKNNKSVVLALCEWVITQMREDFLFSACICAYMMTDPELKGLKGALPWSLFWWLSLQETECGGPRPSISSFPALFPKEHGKCLYIPFVSGICIRSEQSKHIIPKILELEMTATFWVFHFALASLIESSR